MQEPDFFEIVALIRKEDNRFACQAYDFVRHGLDATVKVLKKKDTERARRAFHVKGEELLAGLRDYALDQFGPMAATVLREWGIKRCKDFGDIVFNLIEYNVFSKTKEDSPEDFSEIYTFEDAFVKPFLPKRPRLRFTAPKPRVARSRAA